MKNYTLIIKNLITGKTRTSTVTSKNIDMARLEFEKKHLRYDERLMSIFPSVYK